jgi:WD40 repeat protein
MNVYNMSAVGLTSIANITGHSSSSNNIIQINTNQVITVGNDHTAIVWNVNTNTLVARYYGHTNALGSAAVLSSGMLATCSMDSSVLIWDMQRNALFTSIGFSVRVNSVHMNAVNGYFVVSTSSLIALYNPTSFTLVNTKNTGLLYWSGEVLLPSGNMIMCGPGAVDVWTLPAFNKTFSTATLAATRCKLLPDNMTVVIGTYTGPLTLFNSNTSTLGSSYNVHTDQINTIGMSPDRFYVVTCSNDYTVVVWLWNTMSLTNVKTHSLIMGGMAVVIASSWTGM